MTDDKLLPFDLSAVRCKKLTVDFDGGTRSCDAGLLPLRETERQLGVYRRSGSDAGSEILDIDDTFCAAHRGGKQHAGGGHPAPGAHPEGR